MAAACRSYQAAKVGFFWGTLFGWAVMMLAVLYTAVTQSLLSADVHSFAFRQLVV